jgi:hypothetical protein
MTNTVRNQAAALRIGLLAGYVAPAEVVAWADRLVASDTGRAVPALFDISLSAGHSAADTVSLLTPLAAGAEPRAVGRAVASLIHRRLAARDMDAASAARALYLTMLEGYSPDSDFESRVYAFDDGIDLALRGIHGTVDGVAREMLGFLARYMEASTDSPTAGA